MTGSILNHAITVEDAIVVLVLIVLLGLALGRGRLR